MDDRGGNPLMRQTGMKRSFRFGIHASLTACSQEDFRKAFAKFTPTEQEHLHRFFTEVVSSMQKSIEDEFEDICRDVEVGKVLDTVELLVEEHHLDPLSSQKSDINEAWKHLLEIKKAEVNHLMGMVEKAEEQKRLLSSRIESLKNERTDVLGATDFLDKLRTLNNNVPQAMNP
ncbi:hypothetical protein DM860_006464 [Cuscuta australis]|uniref:Uncharacterized protein n=1 Tax=Cuscuta australis TaxID=267555 RepID=A0A328D4Q8_9ASTE|nr:hypothetical protein DM860_006464 [Cuscuta australis]